MKRLLVLLVLLVPLLGRAEEPEWPLDHAPVDLQNKASLQRGARIFVNHCLNCHSASAMRYSRLEDLALTAGEIKKNLLFTADKIGETMTTATDPVIEKAAFGVVPPDLSVIARSRSADWLYTYLRSFYRDPANKTGWNNVLFRNVAMPHALWEYQGEQALEVTERKDPNTGETIETRKLVLRKPGKLTPIEYDSMVGDLVNYLAYMSEPSQTSRRQWGIVVLFFLAILFVLTYLLKHEYWKDVR